LENFAIVPTTSGNHISYPHMPILRVARAHAHVAYAMAALRGRRNRCVRFWVSGELLGSQVP